LTTIILIFNKILVSEYKLFKVKILKCDRFNNILVLKGFRYHPRFNLTFFPQNFSFIILLWLSCIWRIRIWIWIHWLCWFRNGVFFKRLMTPKKVSFITFFFLNHVYILQWNLTKLGSYLVLKRIWNLIDFQGQRSMSPKGG
jgi:hypothetical protein